MSAAVELRAYFAAQPPAVRRILKQVRADLRAALSGADDVISYKIPALRVDGRIALWYAGWKNHVSVYPVGPAIVRTLGRAVANLETAKGTLRFPLERPPSAALLKRIAKARLAQMGLTAPSASRRTGTGSRYTSPSRRPPGTSRSRSR
jgi:uncharacterized protein YdhG (YjbR/CyaY superfamily)